MNELQLVKDELDNEVGTLPAIADANLGTVALTAEERHAIDQPADLDRIAVRPDPQADGGAIIYLPHEFFRDRLREAVGFGAFALKTIKTWGEERGDHTLLYVWGALYVRGSFVADSIGSAKYYPTNKQSDYSDAFKSAKSNCFVRCCSDSGLGLEAWRPKFRNDFIKEHCIKVVVKADGKLQAKWRRRDAVPFDGEQPETPNQAAKETPAAGKNAIEEDVIDLNGEPAKASAKQIEQLKQLTKDLNAAAVAAALKQRRVSSFEELSAKQADNIISRLSQSATA